jgi:hypothetical protein
MNHSGRGRLVGYGLHLQGNRLALNILTNQKVREFPLIVNPYFLPQL